MPTNRFSKVFVAISALSVALGATQSFADTKSDNTKINHRDLSKHELTADRQPLSGPDYEITKKIRQELVADKKLSTYAHNVKVITVNGDVTVKGPVRNEDEKNTVLSFARSVHGVNKVVNEMTVVAKK